MKKENKYKKLRQETIQLHKEEIERKAELQKRSEANENYVEYKRVSWFKWWDWLIVLFVPWAIFGIIVLIGYLIGSYKFSEWILLSTGLVIIFCWLLMGWSSNRTSAKYYNDSRMRYAKIYDAENAVHRKIRIITLITGIIVALSSLIVFFAF